MFDVEARDRRFEGQRDKGEHRRALDFRQRRIADGKHRAVSLGQLGRTPADGSLHADAS